MKAIATASDNYCGIPFKAGGRQREGGLDCAGLSALWINDNFGLDINCPPSETIRAEDFIKDHPFDEAKLERGYQIFFRCSKTGEVRHVVTWLGYGSKILHTVGGCESRIENGFMLLRRLGYEPVGQLAPHEAKEALRDRKLGYQYIIASLVSALLSLAASFLLRPRVPKFRNESGRYGFDALITRTSAQLPLPDVLGRVALAGNSPYQTQIDKAATVSNPALQKINKAVVFAAGPIEDTMQYDIHVNGIATNDIAFYDAAALYPDNGFKVGPAQTKAEAVEGTIGVDTNRPSLSIYKGTPDITVPVDIRAHYDRSFPIYGFSGCAYIVFRLIDSNKFASFNVVAVVKGRKCRTFTDAGFVMTTVSGESLSGADGSKVRFKLANIDIKEVTALTVNGNSYSHISASAQTGNVYQLNKLKGFVEFITAPAAAATILITYKYYPRAWTCNPAAHVVYLLTEKLRGLGKDESKINWPSAVIARDYYDEDVTWSNPDGMVTEDRYCSSYAIDVRKPIQDHIRAVLDAAYSYLLLSNGKYVIKPRKAESSVYSFTTANIALDASGGSTFRSFMVPKSDRANQVRVFFHSQDTYNAEDDITRADLNDQSARIGNGNDGVVEEALRLSAVDRKTQSERLGETIVRENVNMKWGAEWATTIKGIALEPGDVVDVTHSSQPSWAAKLFRIERVGYDSLDRMTIRVSEYFAGAYV